MVIREQETGVEMCILLTRDEPHASAACLVRWILQRSNVVCQSFTRAIRTPRPVLKISISDCLRRLLDGKTILRRAELKWLFSCEAEAKRSAKEQS